MWHTLNSNRTPLILTRSLSFTLLLALSCVARGDSPLKPRFTRLELTPKEIRLEGREARQQIRVTALLADGTAKDVTALAHLELSPASAVRLENNITLLPQKNGTAILSARYDSLTTQAPIVVAGWEKPFRWSFQNHVEAVLSRQGCNMGICHGGASGKGGFKLSLRAYDPEKDYERLRYEGKGRRILSTNPLQSLLLLKPTLAVAHSGGMRLQKGTLEYRVLKEWIGAGALPPETGSPSITRIEVFPKERVLLPKEGQHLLVTAHFSDGHHEDITHWAKYTSNDEQTAQVDASGNVHLLAQGEATINVWYLGRVAYSRLRAPFSHPSPTALTRANLIDDFVNQKLLQLRLQPSEPSSDALFLRRVMLDVIGVLPTPEEQKAFVKDPKNDKRTRLIEALLKRPEYVDYWTYRWCDLLRVSRNTLGNKGLAQFYQWVKSGVAENRPWNDLTYSLLTATGSSQKNGATNFYRIGSSPEEYAETVSQAFMGIRMQCAHCHNHPHEKWTQADYYRMASLFARVERKHDPKQKDSPDPEEFIEVNQTAEVSHPRLGKPQPPAPLDGTPLSFFDKSDRRVAFAKWLVAPQNPFFARSFVNRVWKYLMGQGLFEPVDDLRVTNPATNEPLLDALSRWFVQSGYNMRELIRLIVSSDAYQRSSRLLPNNREDDRYYARYLPRRLPAETLLDAIGQVTGRTEAFEGLPAGTRTSALSDTTTPSTFLDLFGRPVRQITCECERGNQTSVSQMLHLVNAPTLNSRLQASGGRLESLLRQYPANADALGELYRICLSREPTYNEQRQLLGALNGIEGLPPAERQTARTQIFADIFWAILSGKEFLFNH